MFGRPRQVSLRSHSHTVGRFNQRFAKIDSNNLALKDTGLKNVLSRDSADVNTPFLHFSKTCWLSFLPMIAEQFSSSS
jgi:hypothetical protein